MNRFLRVGLFALLLIVPLSAHAQGSSNQDSLAGQPVERFEVVGNSSVAADTIRVYLGVVPGEPYNPTAIQKNFLNLWQTGLFDDIRIEAEKGEKGVIVKAIVKERPRIGSVLYKGNKNLTVAKIQEALEKEKIDLHVGNTIEQTQVQRAAEAIKKAYAENGYEGVTVAPTMEDTSVPAEKKIVFNINEGIKARVAAIDFVGNKRFSNRRLRKAMKEVKKHNLYTQLRKRDLYIPSKLDEDLEKVRNLYLDYGYRDIEIGDPKITTVRRGKRPRVKITIPISEGQVHKFDSISVSGNTVFTTDQMIGGIPLKKGDVLSRKPIQDRVDAFEDAYRRRGYIYAYINPVYESVGERTDKVKLEVYEGDQFRLGQLEFEGNTVTKDKVLRREVLFNEGDVMDMEAFKASMYKLGQLGYFKITDNPDFKVNPDSKTVDVTVKGEEQGKNDIQFGGGYSEAYGFFAQFQFATRNFLGEGESLGASFQRGARQNFFSLSYSDPWFLDKPNSFAVSIFNRDTTLPPAFGYNSSSKGGSIGYGFRVGRFENISFLYGLEDRKDHYEFSPVPDSEGTIPLPEVQDLAYRSSTFAPSYRYDSRDNPFDTMRGAKFSLSVGFSGGPLGGTIDLTKPVLNYSIFHPLSRKSTVSFNAEAGKIFSRGKDCAELFSQLTKTLNQLCVPQSERFYVGGEQSVRGFRWGTIGGKETVNGREVPVGGESYTVFNSEYIYKINDPLRFVLFADGGAAYAHGQQIDFGQLRYSAGAELRIFLPVFQFPLRFIYSFNPDSHPGDQFETFQFSVGNTF
ncbi:MAG: outer membrane protein assembly factor BamA [Thermoanaerobaculia bacterium]